MRYGTEMNKTNKQTNKNKLVFSMSYVFSFVRFFKRLCWYSSFPIYYIILAEGYSKQLHSLCDLHNVSSKG